jgi:hypothetical protein
VDSGSVLGMFRDLLGSTFPGSKSIPRSATLPIGKEVSKKRSKCAPDFWEHIPWILLLRARFRGGGVGPRGHSR